MVARGYEDARTIMRRVAKNGTVVMNPVLMEMDTDAGMQKIIETGLNQITEPIVAAPNDLNNVKTTIEVAGDAAKMTIGFLA